MAEEGERGIALFQEAGTRETARGFGEMEFVVMLEDDEGVWGQETGGVGGEESEDAVVVGVVGVRRIDEDEIDWRS